MIIVWVGEVISQIKYITFKQVGANNFMATFYPVYWFLVSFIGKPRIEVAENIKGLNI